MTGLRAVEVTSAVGNRIATRDTKFAHPDFVVAILRLEGGATMKVTANLGCVSPHFHAVRVYGTEATFHNGLPDGVLHAPAPPPEGAVSTPVTSAYPGVEKGDLIHSFVESILTGVPARVTADDVFTTLEVCFAIERALRSGAAESVTSLG
jgi:predicted dehydrogenase